MCLREVACEEIQIKLVDLTFQKNKKFQCEGKMKVAFVSSMFRPIQSGSSHYAKNVVEGLAARGHQVLLISHRHAINSRDDYTMVRLPSISAPRSPLTHGYPIPFCFHPLSIPLVTQILRDFQPDVVHANGHFLDASLSAASAARHLGIPLCITVHTRFVHTNTILNAMMRYIERSYLRRTWSSADMAVALDRQMFLYITKELGIDGRHVHSIPLALDFDSFLSYPKEHITYPCFNNGMRTILSVSHLTNMKSASTLLRAFKIVSDIVHDVQLVFVGKVLSPIPRRLVSDLGISTKVHFLGEVRHTQIPSLLRNSIMEVHSLDSRTGFDNASIEAMALGVPVLSCVRSDNFGRPLLKNGDNVILVPPRSVESAAEAMRKVLNDAIFAEKISENASKSARGFFSTERLLDDIEQMYSSAMRS